MINSFPGFWDQKREIGMSGSTHPWAPFGAISDTRFFHSAVEVECNNARITVHVILMQFNLTCSLVAFLSSVMQWIAFWLQCIAVQCCALQSGLGREGLLVGLCRPFSQLLFNLWHPKVANPLNIIQIQHSIHCHINPSWIAGWTKISLTNYHFKDISKLLKNKHKVLA